MGAQTTETVLGIKKQGIFRRSPSTAPGLNHGECCDFPRLCQGTVLTPLDDVMVGAVRPLDVQCAVKHYGKLWQLKLEKSFMGDLAF